MSAAPPRNHSPGQVRDTRTRLDTRYAIRLGQVASPPDARHPQRSTSVGRCLAAVCLPILLASLGCSNKLNTTFVNAQKLLLAREYKQAIAEFNKILASDPKAAAAYFGIGRAYFELAQAKESPSPADYEDAIQAYLKGLQYAPHAVDAHLSVGIAHAAIADILRKQGKPDQARAECLKALDAYVNALVLDPNHERAYYRIGLLYNDIGAVDRAVYYFKRCLELDPRDSEPYYFLGLISAEQNKLDEAAKYLGAAVGLKTDFRKARLALGSVLFRAARYRDAILHLRLVAAEENIPDVHRQLAQCYAKTGRLADAVSEYENFLARAQREDDKKSAEKELAGLQKVLKQIEQAKSLIKTSPDRALALLDEVVAAHPASAEAHSLRATLLQDKPQEALKALELAYATSPDDKDIVSRLSSLYFRLDMFEKCEDVLKSYLKDEEAADPEFYLLRARTLWKLGRLDEANEQYATYLTNETDSQKQAVVQKEWEKLKNELLKASDKKE